MLLLYWVGSPVQHEQANRRNRQMRTAAAARDLALDKGPRHLPVGYIVITHHSWRTHFRTFALPVGAYV